SGATVRITGNYLLGQDALIFTAQSGITGIWNLLTGTLTLSGVASVAGYQAALRSILYANTSSSPSPLPRTVSFVADDGTDPSAAAFRTVTIVPQNDPPVIVASPGTALYIENSAPVTVDPGVLVVDVDSATLTGATIRITANYAAGQDVLAFVDQAGITGS